jgi:hypothetical protein
MSIRKFFFFFLIRPEYDICFYGSLRLRCRIHLAWFLFPLSVK